MRIKKSYIRIIRISLGSLLLSYSENNALEETYATEIVSNNSTKDSINSKEKKAKKKKKLNNEKDSNIYLINADEAEYLNNDVFCKGNVVIMYQDCIISAKKISFNQKSETIIARDDVILKDANQNAYFFDYLLVNKDFKSGNGRNIKIIMSDKSRLAANRCILNNKKFELLHAVYTPCYKCLSLNKQLTWQIKAEKVWVDLEDSIEYQNLVFEGLGAPLICFPYLSIPSPKIKRKTGFLAPRFSLSSKQGLALMPQFFWNISNSQDLIIKPIFTQKIGSVAWAYYGHKFRRGELSIDASITGTRSAKKAKKGADLTTDPKNTKYVDKILKSGYRGHIFSNFRYQLNETWRCSSSINLASDKYYLKRFPFLHNNDRVLESNVLLEGFDGPNYTLIKSCMFQTNIENDEAPKAIPIIERNFEQEILEGTLNIDTIFMNLYFNHHRQAQKMACNISWSKEFLGPFGHFLEIKLMTALKALTVEEKKKSRYDSFFDITPQLSVIWKWPLLLKPETLNLNVVFTPIFGIIAGGNKKHVDVFEEQMSEVNAMNFLEGSKSISPYNIDYGSRICYGAKLSFYEKDGRNLGQFIIGRTSNLTNIGRKPAATGLKHRNSEIATALDIFISDEFTFTSNANYSTKKGKWSKYRYGIQANYEYFDTDFIIFKGHQCSYNPFFVEEKDLDTEEKYKGSMVNLGIKPNKHWHFSSNITFGSNKNRLIKYGIGLAYKNECAKIDMAIEHTKYKRGDLKPEISFWIVVTLKNFGE